MIEAREARRLASKNKEDMLATEFAEIERRIMYAVKEGKYSISHSGHIQGEVANALVSRGYMVTTGSQYNEPYYYISWR